MHNGTDRHAEHQDRVSTERLIAQRNQARLERDDLHLILKELVRLKLAPNSAHYKAVRIAAWQAARNAINPQEEPCSPPSPPHPPHI
jgi:hypothetical protein